MKSKAHISVMPREAIEYLNVKPNGFYIDCTLGEAGHSLQILDLLNENGLLISIDQDQEAIEFVRSSYQDQLSQGNWQVVNENFTKLESIVEKTRRSPDGILMDLGLSSRQLDASKRGFSIKQENQPLDMRMDNRLGVTAKDLLVALTEQELTQLIRTYGEENYAKSIANRIKSNIQTIETVGDLVQVITGAVPATASKYQTSSIRRVFQALRIAVNDELNSLQSTLKVGLNLLNDNGRFVVISFHSLEDRIVKQAFQSAEKEAQGRILTKKPILPTNSELENNSRAHSAKLRCFEKQNKELNNN